MRASFLLLATADLLVMSLTSVVGLTIGPLEQFHRHFLLGVLTALFTCFVHIVLFMYFVVQDKIIKQSILYDGLAGEFAARVGGLKSLGLRWSMIGIASMLLTVTLGAAIGVFIGPTGHLLAAFATIALNALAFAFEYDLLRRFAGLFREAFGEAG